MTLHYRKQYVTKKYNSVDAVNDNIVTQYVHIHVYENYATGWKREIVRSVFTNFGVVCELMLLLFNLRRISNIIFSSEIFWHDMNNKIFG